MNNAGDALWHRFAGSTGVDIGTGVAATSDGGFVIGGEVAGATSIPGPPPYLAFSGVANDALVAKFTTAGAMEWYTHAGAAGSESAFGIAVTQARGP